jgi:LuxR family transcriptional regulator, maltose regulon positive regulatory protein
MDEATETDHGMVAGMARLAPLLATKLHVPLARSTVARPRLLRRLDGAFNSRLTLVAASAGFGKTTLLVEWLSELPRVAPEPVACGWLSLDEADNEPLRFCDYFVAAMRQIDPRIGHGLREALQAPEPPDLKTVLAAVLNDVVVLEEEESGRHLLLVLDDYHVIDHPGIESVMTFLLDHLPARMHLVVATRVDPALPLARLRARSQITEVRTHDLRFTDEEARLFVREARGLPLSEAAISSIRARTEGWIAGMHLAAVALQATDDAEPRLVAELETTPRYIIDYLADEVFHRQTLEVQQFLLETSILRRMCAPLCDAVRRSDDSLEMIDRLRQINLFVEPLDQLGSWYRYHQLFAELLRQRARRTIRSALPGLHCRASDWYASLAATASDDEAIAEAFFHALAAPDVARAVALIQRFGDAYWERGLHDRLRHWLAALPHDLVAASPPLAVLQAWLHATAGSYEAADALLVQAEQRIGMGHDADELRGRIAATRAFLATFRGDPAKTIVFAEHAMTLLSGPRSSWRAGAAIALGDARALHGDTVVAGEAYRQALAISKAAGNTYMALNAGFKLAGMQRQRGMLSRAFDTCSAHIIQAEQTGLAQTSMAGCLMALRGDILCEWNRLPEALAETRLAMEASTIAQHVGLVGWIHLYRMRVLLASHDFGEAEATLQRLEMLAQPSMPPWIVSPIAALKMLLALVRGDLGAAIDIITERQLAAGATIPVGRELEYLTLVRVLAVQRRFADAHHVLQRLAEATTNGGRAGIAIVVLLTRARLFLAEGNHQQAIPLLHEALRLGEPGRFVRVFIDGGEALLPLIRTAAGVISQPYLDQLVAALSPGAAPAEPRPPLSERELEILRLVASGLKNQEIASRLVISLNTVLYHTKNIYGKLEVTHRTQAVQRARELSLL